MFRNNWMLYKFRLAELHANIRKILFLQGGHGKTLYATQRCDNFTREIRYDVTIGCLYNFRLQHCMLTFQKFVLIQISS